MSSVAFAGGNSKSLFGFARASFVQVQADPRAARGCRTPDPVRQIALGIAIASESE